jgi:uncharacterized membrane-anchored protein
MIVVTGTAAVVLMIVGVVIWIAESANKARRLAAQRAKNRELKAQTAAQTRPQPNAGDQPPSMPYGM